MKSIFLRAVLALALGLALASCGGKAEFTVKGSISGLVDDGLILRNGSASVSPAANATSFAFPAQVSYGDSYDVTIAAAEQPQHESCTILNGTDTAGRFAAINVVVTCAKTLHHLSGTITGLGTATLVLTNGSQSTAVVGAGDSITYSLPDVADGTTYGVVVFTQPAGLTCTVSNGSGTMGTADVSVPVNCVANAP
jgi:hypothetical protein